MSEIPFFCFSPNLLWGLGSSGEHRNSLEFIAEPIASLPFWSKSLCNQWKTFVFHQNPCKTNTKPINLPHNTLSPSYGGEGGGTGATDSYDGGTNKSTPPVHSSNQRCANKCNPIALNRLFQADRLNRPNSCFCYLFFSNFSSEVHDSHQHLPERLDCWNCMQV